MVTILLSILSLIGAFISLILSIYFLFLFLFLLRDLIDDIFYRDEESVRTMRKIVADGKYKSLWKNIIYGQCTMKHDRIKTGVFALIDKKTNKIEVKTCSRPDNGLIASTTRDA